MKTMLANKRLLAMVCSFAVLLSALAIFTLPAYAEQDQGASVNLLAEHMASIKSVQQDKTTGAVSDSNKFDKVFDLLTDGDTTVRKDVGTGDLTDLNQGVQITLDKAYTLSQILLLTGISSYPDYLKVYASEKLADLYTADSLLGEDLQAKGSVEINTTVKAKYIAVLVTATTVYTTARPFEYQIMGVESSGTDVDEDLGGDTGDTYKGINLIDQIVELAGLLQDRTTGAVTIDERFSKAARDVIHDGVTNVHTDVYGAHDWEQPRNVGVRLTLNVPLSVEKLVLYSGLSGYPDTLKVYASDQLSNLYADTSLIQKDVVCVGEAQEIAIGKTIQYVAIFITSDGTWRPKEFELYAPEGTDVPEVIPSQNLLAKHMLSIKSVQQDQATGVVSDSTKFDNVLDILTDGDTSGRKDVTIDNLTEVSQGVQITLDKVYTLSKISLLIGISSHPDYLTVYASEKLADLYTADSLLDKDLEAKGTAEINTTATVRYIAVFVTATTQYNIARPCEYQVLGFESTGTDTGEGAALPLAGDAAGEAGILKTLVNDRQGLRFNYVLNTVKSGEAETVTVDGVTYTVSKIGMLVTTKADANLTVGAMGVQNGYVRSARSITMDGDTVTYNFSILVKNIPQSGRNTSIHARPYLECVDSAGKSVILYGSAADTSVYDMYTSLGGETAFGSEIAAWMGGN